MFADICNLILVGTRVKKILGLVLVLSVALAGRAKAETLSGDMPINIAHIQSSMLGAVLLPTDPYTVQMNSIVQSGGYTVPSYEKAAEALINHPLFMVTLKNMIQQWMTTSFNITGAVWNKSNLLFVHQAIAMRDVSTIFTTNLTCLPVIAGVATEPGQTTDANIQAAFNAAAAAGQPAVSAIQCMPGQFTYTQDGNGNPVQGTQIPAAETAGMLTAGGNGTLWQAAMTNGTGNRFAYIVYGGVFGCAQNPPLTINDFRDPNAVGSIAPQYVPRDDFTTFNNTCKNCHGTTQTKMTTVVCQKDADSNGEFLMDSPTKPILQDKCGGSHGNQNTVIFQDGNTLAGDTFTDIFPPAVASSIKDTHVGFTGTGISAVGTWLTYQELVWDNLMYMAYQGQNGFVGGGDPQNFNYSGNRTKLTAGAKYDFAGAAADAAADGVVFNLPMQ
jgi:hypothetical protein